MLILFCSHMMNPYAVDDEYLDEYEIARQQGIQTALIELEQLLDGRTQQAIARIPRYEKVQQAVYRGWMMEAEVYGRLYKALLQRNVQLINTTEQYAHCHYFPNAYEVIREYTPRTIHVPVEDMDEQLDTVFAAISTLGDGPAIVKDYVKSRKHEWAEACYIPELGNREQASQIIRRFVERQGEQLSGGLVIREYYQLEHLTDHPQSGMPLSREFRLFFLEGQPIFVTEYWDEGKYGNTRPPLEIFIEIAGRVASRFFTMDVVKQQDGPWSIMELGDGQVSGLTQQADLAAFYRNLQNALEHEAGK